MNHESCRTGVSRFEIASVEGGANMSGYLRRTAVGLWPGAGAGEGSLYRRHKHALEWAASLLTLVVSLPVVLLAAALVKLTSRGPAFYLQKRVGLNGRVFTICKVRTMTHNCEADTGPQWSPPGDTRITPVGRVLRALHLDELPQLWNVLRGDMNLIGPRPERPEIVRVLRRKIDDYEQRLNVLPGITGLAQVQLAADTDVQSVRRKLALDLAYIEQHGLWLDARIAFATVLKMFATPRAVIRRLFTGPASSNHTDPPEVTFTRVENVRVA
jgi:lipopolysaccharide/colanic/teichoic acid biosynthesis glycosyltransferase